MSGIMFFNIHRTLEKLLGMLLGVLIARSVAFVFACCRNWIHRGHTPPALCALLALRNRARINRRQLPATGATSSFRKIIVHGGVTV